MSTLAQGGAKRLITPKPTPKPAPKPKPDSASAAAAPDAEPEPATEAKPASAGPASPANLDAVRAALGKLDAAAHIDPNRHHTGSPAKPGAAPSTPRSTTKRSRRGELHDSLYGPTGGDAMDINSMRNGWPEAMGRARAALETAQAEILGILPGVEGAPINPAVKDMYRELTGLVSGLPERVDAVNAATHEADEQYWRDFAEGGLDNGKAWTND